jgi:hypothetical protein
VQSDAGQGSDSPLAVPAGARGPCCDGDAMRSRGVRISRGTAVSSSLARVRAAIRTLTAFLSSEGMSQAATLIGELETLQVRIDESQRAARRSRRRRHLGPRGTSPLLTVRPLAAESSLIPPDRG